MRFKELFYQNPEIRKKRFQQKIEEEAKEIYQLREFHGELWLTYNGFLVCPTSLFSEDELTALSVIRKLYVERNTPSEDD